MVSLAVMLVFAGFLPPASPRAHDPSDETSAQVGRFASGGEAALFQVLGLASVGCPALVHLPAYLGPRANATACFDSTRGFPGEGPNSDSTAMDADKFGHEPAAAASNDDQLRIANEVYGPQTESKKTQKGPVFEKFSKSGFKSGSDPLISYF